MSELRDTLASGSRLKSTRNEYKIEAVLGRGGFGITYRASYAIVDANIKARATVAIKEHFPMAFAERKDDAIQPVGSNGEMYQRSLSDFKSEAERLHKLGAKHPNIVGVNEVFASHNTAYYVMEFVDGRSLLSYVNEHGGLPYEEALQIMLPVMGAVAYLHANRVNHLDVKPDNIMLHAENAEGSECTPVLIDFGLSMHYDSKGNLTRDRGTLGASDGYAPIEQYSGIRSFSPGADVYALAATMLHVLTGKQPAEASQLKTARVREQLEALKIPSKAIDAICNALAFSADDRTPNVLTFMDELGIRDGDGGKRGYTAFIKPGKGSTRKVEKNKGGAKRLSKAVKWGICAVAMLVVAAGGYAVYSSGKEKVVEEETALVDNRQVSDSKYLVADANEGTEQSEAIRQNDEMQNAEPEEKPRQETENKKEPGQMKTQETQPDSRADTRGRKPDSEVAPSVSRGTISMSAGSYTGELLDGRPHGRGRLTYTVSRSVAGVRVEPGCYYEGTWENGRMGYGKIYDASGNLLGSKY